MILFYLHAILLKSSSYGLFPLSSESLFKNYVHVPRAAEAIFTRELANEMAAGHVLIL